ncbi:uncharacterized protein LOC120202561 [Hibiscus syriacus]|uniref:uncharacterized protein LOC120202561 n=1 Tax=Hibiscus syriacus TaxID=106335 RepID=UPI001924E549|nr:uncharacterized protein LOC120202561 [Hibiscus syriacus]
MSVGVATDWRSLFAAGNEQELDFFPPSEAAGLLVVKPPRDVFEEGILEWRHALVGQFIGSTSNFGLLQKTVDLMWGKAAPVKVSLAGSNLFVFSFDNSLARDWVLENGPWHVQHKPLFLRKWEPNLKELHFDLDRMPIWIQLFNVPLELFSKKGLSYITSAIGKPLHMDSITASRARLEYSRVCVEISVGSKIPDFVDVLLYDESVVRIKGVIDNSLAGLEVMSDGVETIPAQEKIVNTSPAEIVVKCYGLCTESSNFSEQSIPNNGTLVEVMCVGKVHADSSRDNMAGLNAHVGNSGSNPPIKRGRGRPGKEPKVALGASKNKFEVLTSIDPENLLPADDGKKQRAASLGVSKLVQDLKLKKKEQLDKRKVINWATSCHISILCLLETRVKEINSADILNRSFSDWDSYCNYNHVFNGRIWVLWHKYLACSVIPAYDQSVSIKGSFEGQSFCVTAVYGLNDGNARRHLWNQLISLDIVNLPWLIGGDFNIILNLEESSGSINASTLADISDFQRCVENLGVFDHPFTGPLLTWSNKQHDLYLARKLDRVLVNSAWIDAFPESDMEFLAPGDSEHCPAVVWLRKTAPVTRPKPFRFFNFWALHPDFLAIVRDSWQVPVEGNPAQVLFQKLKRLKYPLRYLNKIHFNDISNQVKLKREELMRIQLANLSAGSIVNDEMQAERELHSLEEAEMLF